MTAPLDVLLVNHADLGGGGASVAGHRLHHQLRAAGVASHMLVGTRTTDDPDISVLRTPGPLRRPLRAATAAAGLNELDGVAAYGLVRRSEYQRADVVHYHAIHGGWFSYPAMGRLAGGDKPSVLTLHDQWPLTGHCSFSFGCERWRGGCGSCPHPEVFPAIRRDATAVEWRLKRRVWSATSLTVVSPSRWLAEVSRASMLGHLPVEVIPHGIDTATFAPVDPDAARRALRIDPSARVVCFAASSVEDRRKGFDLAVAALGRLPAALRRELVVVLVGSGGAALGPALDALGCRSLPLGFVPSDTLKAVAYSAADLFVFPTRADNAPLVVLEALACGTPVVSFDVGGVGETVRDGETGLLARPEDTVALAAAVTRLLEYPEERAAMGAAGRAMAVAEHAPELAAVRHLALYDRLVGR